MAYGDHIYVDRGWITHHGIEMQDGWAIHFASVDGTKSGAAICWVRIEDFASGGKIEIRSYGKRFSDKDARRRGRSRCSGNPDTTYSPTTASTLQRGASQANTAALKSRLRCVAERCRSWGRRALPRHRGRFESRWRRRDERTKPDVRSCDCRWFCRRWLDVAERRGRRSIRRADVHCASRQANAPRRGAKGTSRWAIRSDRWSSHRRRYVDQFMPLALSESLVIAERDSPPGLLRSAASSAVAWLRASSPRC